MSDGDVCYIIENYDVLCCMMDCEVFRFIFSSGMVWYGEVMVYYSEAYCFMVTIVFCVIGKLFFIHFEVVYCGMVSCGDLWCDMVLYGVV